MKNRIVLIGFMASGKTTLGKKIANNLHIPFIDSDEEIERHFGASIEEIFKSKGEDEFRNIETNFLKTFDFPQEFVLSTGGGMPCYNNNIKLINELGNSFYLKRAPKELVNRLLKAKEIRPLVMSKSESELLEYVENSLLERESYYYQANTILEREEQSVEYLCNLFNQV